MKNSKMTIFVLIIAAACIITGIVAGEPHSVWTKAARICLECIGIG